MSQVDTPIENVSDTSYWVAHYRAKESQRRNPLFRDPLAAKLVGTRGAEISRRMGRLSRYTEWSVISRTVIIDRFVEKLVREGVDAVINLGAGFDTRPYRMNLPSGLLWVECDYPQIVNHKNAVLKNEDLKCRLERVSVDFLNPLERRVFLKSVATNARKVLVLTEGVIPYLSQAEVRDLSDDLTCEPRFAYWIAEYFHRNAYPFLLSKVRTDKMRNAPFKFYPDDWYGFFAKLGWKERETCFTYEIAKEFRRKPPLPLKAKLLMAFMPAKVKEKAMRMSGYVIFERA